MGTDFALGIIIGGLLAALWQLLRYLIRHHNGR